MSLLERARSGASTIAFPASLQSVRPKCLLYELLNARNAPCHAVLNIPYHVQSRIGWEVPPFPEAMQDIFAYFLYLQYKIDI